MRNNESKLLLSQLVICISINPIDICTTSNSGPVLDILQSSLPSANASVFIYTSQRRVGKFEFVLIRRLHVAATLFCPEFTLLVF